MSPPWSGEFEDRHPSTPWPPEGGPAPVPRPVGGGPVESTRRHRGKRRVTRLELGTYANDLDAAAAFLGRTRKSLEGYLADGITPKFRCVLDRWATRQSFPIDTPLPPEIIGHAAHEAIHALRAGQTHIAGPMAAYALDTTRNDHRTGRPNAPDALQSCMLRVIVALSWVTNSNPVGPYIDQPEGLIRMQGLHDEIDRVIVQSDHRRGTAAGDPWFQLHELSASFVLCHEMLKILVQPTVMLAGAEGTPQREAQRQAADAVLVRLGHLQRAPVARVHSSSRLQWAFVQLATIAFRPGSTQPDGQAGHDLASSRARSAFVRGVNQLKCNYGATFGAIERLLLLDEDTGPLLKRLGAGRLNRD